jgi:hypothetical protein
MDNFVRLTDEKNQRQSRKNRHFFNPQVTAQRIENLKKIFQPFWMRGMRPHKRDVDETLNGTNILI